MHVRRTGTRSRGTDLATSPSSSQLSTRPRAEARTSPSTCASRAATSLSTAPTPPSATTTGCALPSPPSPPSPPPTRGTAHTNSVTAATAPRHPRRRRSAATRTSTAATTPGHCPPLHPVPTCYEFKCWTPMVVGGVLGHGSPAKGGAPSTTDGGVIAFGNTKETLRIWVFGATECGSEGDGPFDRTTGTGWVRASQVGCLRRRALQGERRDTPRLRDHRRHLHGLRPAPQGHGQGS